MTSNVSPPDTKALTLAFENMAKMFVSSCSTASVNNIVGEMEVRFGTMRSVPGSKYPSSKPISKINYDNVVKKLLAAGFTPDIPDGTHMMRIYRTYKDEHSGLQKTSNIRAEIPGIDLIQEYCRGNSIQKILDLTSTVSAISDKIKFTKKESPMIPETTERVRDVDFTDFNFRVSYKTEQDFDARDPVATRIIREWSDTSKIFRLLNRVRFSHPTHPVFADLSIVRSSKSTNSVGIPYYTMQESGVLGNQETYEIELEVDNARVGDGTEINSGEKLTNALRGVIRIVLSALQDSNYPISTSERNFVLDEYMGVIYKDDVRGLSQVVQSRHFIGPSPVTLQINNIIPKDPASSMPNIRHNYTVTEKADGERRMLFVSSNGRIYTINSSMEISMTGMTVADAKMHLSLVDGEFIKTNKSGRVINLYAAFDIYYINGKSVRELAFAPSDDPIVEDTVSENTKKTSAGAETVLYRLFILTDFISKVKPKPLSEGGSRGHPFRLQVKTFYTSGSNQSIFDGCDRILSRVSGNLFEYITDGLIFTPSDKAVGGEDVGVPGPKTKIPWEHAFKWKPPEFNTIDFLVRVKKNKKTGVDLVSNIFQQGINMDGLCNVVQYKTLILTCGFSKKKDGYLNPFLDMINGDSALSTPTTDRESDKDYLPAPFYPTNPSDDTAHLCNVALRDCGNGQLSLTTEENEYFEGEMIVEFRYEMDDPTKVGNWRWIPLRVRYDKTSDLRAGNHNYGNSYHVANSNWTSIHNPITREMISSGTGMPTTELGNDDVYYANDSRKTSTRALRDFHNLYVKKRLIMGVSQRRGTLIDFAVGMGGDLRKWTDANLKFVFGIDVSRDNIRNRLKGACARWLTLAKTRKNIPSALFATGNSSFNIRDGSAFAASDPKDREISNAVFGNGKHDRVFLGEGVYAQYGVAKDGFDVSSVQFAMHYFFENKTTLNNFVRNVAECTKVGGYFIGTCYDGKTVFDVLRKKNEGESITIMRDGVKMYELTKRFSQSAFASDDNGLGHAVDVFQESIGKIAREYLVNFEFLVRTMENYGFSLASNDEAVKMGLPGGSAMFEDLYRQFEYDIEKSPLTEANYKQAGDMGEDEKMISFMNRYFVFRKMRNVDTAAIFRAIGLTARERREAVEAAPEAAPIMVRRRKLKVPKVVLDAGPEEATEEAAEEAAEKEKETE